MIKKVITPGDSLRIYRTKITITPQSPGFTVQPIGNPPKPGLYRSPLVPQRVVPTKTQRGEEATGDLGPDRVTRRKGQVVERLWVQ